MQTGVLSLLSPGGQGESTPFCSLHFPRMPCRCQDLAALYSGYIDESPLWLNGHQRCTLEESQTGLEQPCAVSMQTSQQPCKLLETVALWSSASSTRRWSATLTLALCCQPRTHKHSSSKSSHAGILHFVLPRQAARAVPNHVTCESVASKATGHTLQRLAHACPAAAW